MRLPLTAALAALTLAAPAWAEITIMDAYARVSHPGAKAGAAFMVLKNTGDRDVQLIAAESAAARRVELHTHTEVDGVMQMGAVAGGFTIPAGGSHPLARGGDHVMFMGLAERWEHGALVPVTLIFDGAEPVTLEIEVDLDRTPAEGAGHASH